MTPTGQGIVTQEGENPPCRVVVTGGGTIAPIDDVRFLANVSTGRFSAEITEAALRTGARVWHVHAPSALLPFVRQAHFDLDAPDFDAEVRRMAGLREEFRRLGPHLHLEPFPPGTVSAYARVLRATLEKSRPHMVFLAMAASDFEPEAVAGKIDSGRAEFTLTLRPTPKVIQSVRDWSPSSFLIGFKLLSGVSESTLIASAEQALIKNRADVIVANDLQTVHRENHTIHLVRSGGRIETLRPGGSLADRLVERVRMWAGE